MSNQKMIITTFTERSKPLISLWKDDNIEKLNDGWLCKYCNKKFTGHNVSRVAIHLSGKMLYKKKDIEFCTADIPEINKSQYIVYVQKKILLES